MSKLSYFFIAIFIFSPYSISAHDITFVHDTPEEPFRYWEDNCPTLESGWVAGQKNVLPPQRLVCDYSRSESGSTAVRKVLIKYEKKDSLQLDIRTFDRASSMEDEWGMIKSDFRGGGTYIKDQDSHNFLVRSAFWDEETSTMKKTLVMVRRTGQSIVLSTETQEFYPSRFYQLDSSVTSDRMNAIVEAWKQNFPYPPQEKSAAIVEIMTAIAAEKELELSRRTELEANYAAWREESVARQELWDSQAGVIGYVGCLLWNGLRLDLDTLRKFNIENPRVVCGWELYSKKAKASAPDFDTHNRMSFIENDSQLISSCLTNRVAVFYRTHFSAWLERNPSLELDLVEICKNGCDEGECRIK
ncbi:MAG: hypothetical protein G01um101418_391 [Parcubacteria group bacterium Gr01-1014_18]|nr:MAG: hypothetical protein Greene041636_363 [Parcubacteria group bacterium Greene0416_36]TSC81112.1 MAG: hypothetical protein G01um101418_391 [Parcubacteria group bacterium Gr01-1014_18]TSC98472.1 MAG: hypothetical protein Greene101420_709 [Parcubacteria group bacterium Greene1014_20]TSD07363.1 MAG: hypothetical protein Greene07142_218 [Parcubacteria group bacterium Greene0714_2]